MALSVDIEKAFKGFTLRVAFEAGNETLALLGASGCGKSMTLRCIAGIEKPDRGRIVLDGVTLFDSEKHINLKPQQRHVGLMFQHYALFPQMTVWQNVACGIRGPLKKQALEQTVTDTLISFGLADLKDRMPSQLSGGQQQRTALARIMVGNPGILMLDEPFSALDSHLRFLMEQEVRQIIRRFGKTVLLVSHNRDEVYRMADRVTIMREGQIERIGAKEKVRRRAEFGISVDQAHWGLGVGRALTEACIACAKQAGYAQLELNAVAENKRALSLYESVGFVEYGRNPRGFHSRLTGWQELVLMRLELD